jgi:alanyl-tRNA synthetase
VVIMQANELRAAFLEFFEQRGHTPIASAGLIPHHPSAPMFTNSGMMQFVPYFLGEERVPFTPPRAVTVQKCVRAGGKHNDLDAIGRSPRHLSFFEMLGNFSFGDYFKAEAIAWSWEFITERLGIDGDRMWITCHVSDDEAEEIWADGVGVPRERIQRLDKDNFWEMGETGPCGPSSELFFDFGPEFGPDGGPENPASEHRYVEIWNLVFPQYFRGVDGSLSDLPSKNIDTGAGMERILAVMAGSASLYSADVLSELVDEAQRSTGTRLGESELGDVAVRLLADHTRTMTFLISDGVIPSNEDRGYVLRRIIRRAVRFSYLLGVERLVLEDMSSRCIEIMSDAYPELTAHRDSIIETINREERRFRETLRTGSQLLDGALDEVGSGGTLPGSVAFKLHDTFGFPLEVTREFAELRGVDVDEDGFNEEMSAQRDRARAAAKGTGVAAGEEAEMFSALAISHEPTVFVGREADEAEATVIAVIGEQVVLDRTPFYAESGGQVGDTGVLVRNGVEVPVLDTTAPLAGYSAHNLGARASEFSVGDVVLARIDVDRRTEIRRHHTATHILHWALRSVLGDHVKQQGSWVGPDRLRFDFAHYEALTPTQLREVELMANREILTDASVRHYETSKAAALEAGAIAFFGDKYGDTVRVLEAGAHSVELCGGTHVTALGQIGPLTIISETSIGSNIRRIEAVAGLGPVELLHQAEERLAATAEQVGVPVGDLSEGIRKRLEELKSLREELKAVRRELAGVAAGDLVSTAVDGVVVARVEAESRDEVRDLALSLRERPGIRAVVLMSSPGGKGVAVVSAVTPGSGLNAGALIADALALVGGGGGKGDDLATAGGRNAEGIDAALDVVRKGLGLASGS